MKEKLIYILLLFAFSGCVKDIPSKQGEIFNSEAFHNRYPGASAKELLSDDVYHSLTVEIQFMTGYKPESGTIKNIQKFLPTYLHKPAGIKIILNEIDTVDNKALAKEEVLAIEKTNRSRYSANKDIAIYLIFTNGIHPGNKILGMA